MQCNQPLFCTGFQNNAQFLPCNTQSYYPDVIGEGDVMSYIFPDGSVQYYFLPTNRRERWIPHCTNSYCMPSSLSTWSSNKEAWFVRNILNPYPAALTNQQWNNCGDAFLRSNCNSPSNSFVQKFHYDSCTSTTDLHYFYPPLRQDWAKGCAAIQVELCKEEKCIFHYGTICSRPCYCNDKNENTKLESNNIETPMCVDQTESTHSCDESKKKVKNRKTKNPTCASPTHVDTADKMIVTYADQSISCTDIKDSQAGKRRDIETDVWYPRRKTKKNNTKRSNDAIVCDSACCLGSPLMDIQYGNT